MFVPANGVPSTSGMPAAQVSFGGGVAHEPAKHVSAAVQPLVVVCAPSQSGSGAPQTQSQVASWLAYAVGAQVHVSGTSSWLSATLGASDRQLPSGTGVVEPVSGS